MENCLMWLGLYFYLSNRATMNVLNFAGLINQIEHCRPYYKYCIHNNILYIYI